MWYICPLLYLRNVGRIALKFSRYVARDLLARHFTEVDDGAQLHVRTCAPLFRISGTAGRIALKSGVWLETH